jgi:hypothetical protein
VNKNKIEIFGIYINFTERFDLLACASVYMCQVFNNHFIFKFLKAAKRQCERKLNCLITVHNEEFKVIESTYGVISMAVVSIFISHQYT